MNTVLGTDGLERCGWGADSEIYIRYHDDEWGRPSTDDQALFEKVCLEGFQSGLSWITILRKREAFRAGFAGFDPSLVAAFGERDVARFLADAGIVRHEGKIRSAINNAGRALEIVTEHGSLADYFWGWADPEDTGPSEASITPASTALSKDLKRRGWSFVGPTTIYAFMQSMGLVNDHATGCHARQECERMRQEALANRSP